MAKGSDWERIIAKDLTKWASGQKKEYWYWRTPGSGSLLTIAKQLNLSGDIIHLTDNGKFLTTKFTIECKNGYEKGGLFKIIKDNKDNEIKNFWIQVNRDANKSNTYPMLIFKRKRIGIFVGIPKIDNLLIKLINKNISYVICNFKENLPAMYGFDYNKFFNIITPNDIKEI